MRSKFTEEEKQFIKDNYKGITTPELTKLFNKRFNREEDNEVIRNYKKHNGLKTGIDTRFKKNQVAHNHKPVGSEFVSKSDGYTYVKIAEPNTWDLKQRVIYKQYYGDIATEDSIVFADQNKQNFDIDNLILVKRNVKLMAKNKKLFFEDKELTKTGMLIAEVICKSSELKKKGVEIKK